MTWATHSAATAGLAKLMAGKAGKVKTKTEYEVVKVGKVYKLKKK